MFLPFFFLLRSKKIPVTTSEYLDLLQTLKNMDLSKITPQRFYTIARNCLIKDIKYFDAYDLAFAESFNSLVSHSSDFQEKLKEWLKKATSHHQKMNSETQSPFFKGEDLLKELEKLINKQKERHDGGSKWIGTSGYSPFGHSGVNPQGVRMGGSTHNKTAIATNERLFKSYRSDITLHVRQIKIALKRLRELKQTGKPKLCIPGTLKKSCDQGGEIELVLKKDRKNSLRLVLLMDVGGSMNPYTHKVSQLFSAAHQINHFKEFSYYYFHNVFYDWVYSTSQITPHQGERFDSLYRRWPPDTKVIIVGDATMAPYELFHMNQKIHDHYKYLSFSNNEPHGLTAIERVRELKKKYSSCVWINPEPTTHWAHPTVHAIKEIIPMFHLSLDGLHLAIQELLKN